MNELDKDVMTLLIALGAFVASAIAVIVSINSNSIAKKANRISKQMLKHSEFTYKQEIKPSIVGELSIRYNESGHLKHLIFLNIFNKKPGAATIDLIIPLGFGSELIKYDQRGKEIDLKEYFPFVLKDNNRSQFQVRFSKVYIDEQAIKEKAAEDNTTLIAQFRKEVEEMMKYTKFLVYYVNEMNDHYMTPLEFDSVTNSFKGTPEELTIKSQE